METDQPITIRNLFPEMSEEDLVVAEVNLERYLTVMMRIAERLRTEGFDLFAPDLTASQTEARIPHAKVESPTPTIELTAGP